MGKGSGKLINVLGDLRNAKSGTLFFSDEEIRKLKDVDDKLTKLGNTAKVLAASLFSKNKNELADTMLGRLFGITKTEEKKKTAVDETGALAGIADKEKAAEIQTKISSIEEKNRLAAMSDEERLLDLAKKREEIFQRIATTATQRAQKELDLKLNEQAILAGSKVSELKQDKVKEDRGMSPLKDSLTSIGNFLGANPNSGQLKELSEMNRQLKAIERNTSRVSGGGFPL
jgi:hypothetical protein